VIFEMEQNAIDMIHLLRHVDRVRGPHGELRPHGPRPARRDGHVRRRLVTRFPEGGPREGVPGSAWE
jgi:hypothetical protein